MKPCPEHLVALDLEMNQPSGKIIQIGAVVGDLRSGHELARFAQWVNPGEPLAPAISSLVGVRQPTLEIMGAALPEVYAELQAWLNPWQRALNPLTWGGNDSATLAVQLGISDLSPAGGWPFGRRCTDVKTVYLAWQHSQGYAPVGGLARSLTRVGLAFEGRKHRADDDAWNTFRMYRHLLLAMAAAQAAGD